MRRVLVLHGPNLSTLGTREPDIYGRVTLAEIDQRLRALGAELGCEVETFQTNHEGVLIDAIHGAGNKFDGVLMNPAGLTHTSVALGDAARAAAIPVVEVHLSNPHAREAFRARSMVSAGALGVVQGFGAESYTLALRGLMAHLSTPAHG